MEYSRYGRALVCERSSNSVQWRLLVIKTTKTQKKLRISLTFTNFEWLSYLPIEVLAMVYSQVYIVGSNSHWCIVIFVESSPTKASIRRLPSSPHVQQRGTANSNMVST